MLLQSSPVSVQSEARASIDTTSAAVTHIKAGSFAKRTSAGHQAVNGLGFRPKLLILFGVANTSDGFAPGYQYGFGASDGTNSHSVAGWSWDARGSLGSDTDRRQAPKAITFVGTVASVEAEADLISFDNDGFTLDWTTNNSKAWIIHYLAIGGHSIEARVSSFGALNDSPGVRSYDHVGFRPDLLLLFGAPSRWGPLVSSLGFVDSDGNQFAMGLASRNSGATPTDTARYQRRDRCFVSLDPQGIHVESEAVFVSMDALGFTLDWTTAAVFPQALVSVAIGGISARVGAITEETTSGDVAYTGVGFQPRGALFAGYNRMASTEIEDHNRFALGVAGHEGNGASIWVGDTDNVFADTVTDQGTSGSACYFSADKGSPTSAEMSAQLKSWNADGFTLAWSGSSLTRGQIGYFVLGEPLLADPVGGIAEALDTSESGDYSTSRPFGALAHFATAEAIILMAVAWYARRRWWAE
jgi:hypothetical protein